MTGSCKGPIFETPISFPNGRDTRGIHFYCQWDAVKATSCGEKILSGLPRSVNLKHNLEVSNDVNWSFHMISFIALKSSQKHVVKRLKSYLLHQFFGLHVFREHATWTQSCKRGDETQAKSQPNSRSAPAWYSEAEKKMCIYRLPGNLNRVNTRWKARFAPGIANGGGWGVQMTGTLHHANLSFFLWIIFPTCFRWPVLWKLFHFTTTYCCISVWNEQKMV